MPELTWTDGLTAGVLVAGAQGRCAGRLARPALGPGGCRPRCGASRATWPRARSAGELAGADQAVIGLRQLAERLGPRAEGRSEEPRAPIVTAAVRSSPWESVLASPTVHCQTHHEPTLNAS
jgi:hypothetical protein